MGYFVQSYIRRWLHAFVLIVIFLFGTYSKGFTQKTSAADLHYSKQHFAKAIPIYERVFKKQPAAIIAEKLAYSYYQIKQYEKAEFYYEYLAKQSALNQKTAAYFSEVLKNNNKYASAKKNVVAVYKKNDQQKFNLELDKLENWDLKDPHFYVTKPSGVNTNYSEFAPVRYKDKLVFITERDVDYVYNLNDQRTLTPYLSIVASKIPTDSQSFGKITAFNPVFEHDYHIGPITFDSLYSLAFFTKVDNAKKGKDFVNTPQLFFSSFKDGKWQKPIPFPYNNPQFSLAHPTLSPGGDQLVFVLDSTADESTGKDLFVSINRNGQWDPPEKLGANVTSVKDEMFPVFKDSTTLFFSSNGFTGYGGLDIFITKKVNGIWQYPTNVKKPVNSSRDDFGLSFFTHNTGYFSSNRVATEKSDNIFRFKQIKPFEDKISISGVFLYTALDPAENTALRLYDNQNNFVALTYTDSVGNFLFSELDPLIDYYIKAEAQDKSVNQKSHVLINSKDGKEPPLKLVADAEGRFIFRTLPADHSAKLAVISLENPPELYIPKLYGRAFKTLPKDLPEGLEVLLLDDQGNVLSRAFLDKEGGFAFDYLPVDKNYTIRLKNHQDHTIELYDANGRLIARSKDGFSYTLLSKDQHSLALLKNLNIQDDLTTLVKGKAFSYQTLDFERITLKLYDENDRLIDELALDEKGGFAFQKLSLYKDYKIYISTTDPVVDLESIELFITNDQGQMVKGLYKDNQANYFLFKPLTREEYASLQVFDLNSDGLIAGKVFEKLPGDAPEGLMLYLLDENGLVMDSALVDAFGNFKFSHLAADNKAYTLSFMDAELDDKYKLYICDNSNQLHQLARADQGFVYRLFKRQAQQKLDVYSFENAHLTGVFDFEKPLNDTRLEVLDQNGNTVQRDIKVNSNGTFNIQDLKPYNTYFIKSNEHLGSNTEAFVTNTKGNKVLKMTKEDSLLFRFYTLNSFEYNQLPLYDSSMQLQGEVYHRMPGNPPENLEVFLLDNTLQVTDTARLTSDGKFIFNALPKDQDHLIKITSNLQDVQLSFQDTTLHYVVVQKNASSQIIKVQKQPNLDGFSGMIYHKLQGDLPEGLKVFLLDYEGNIIDSTFLDDKGGFQFGRLPKDNQFKMYVPYYKDQALTFLEFNSSGNLVTMDQDKYFRYEHLDRLISGLYLKKLTDQYGELIFNASITSIKDTIFETVVYHPFDHSGIVLSSQETLLVAMQIALEHQTEVLLTSYTDAKGAVSYNQMLSKRRARFIQNKFEAYGVKPKLIKAKWLDEKDPVAPNTLEDGSDNPAGRELNRRTKIILIKP